MPTWGDLLKEPILPNKGAAGIKLVIRTKAIKELWGDPLSFEQIAIGKVHWEYQDVDLWFTIDKLDQIGIQGFYEGKTRTILDLY